MTGLEKILKAIEADALKNAQAVVSLAEQEAKEILSAAKNKAEKKCNEIALKSETDVKAVLSRADSSAALQKKKLLLDAKQQIISNVITKARNSLTELEDSNYTDILLLMVKKNAHKKPGFVLLSEADKKRLPKNFESMLKKTLSETKGASLTVAEETVKLDGGFILKYGDVEENCSFDALFAAAIDELQDKVNTFLFE